MQRTRKLSFLKSIFGAKQRADVKEPKKAPTPLDEHQSRQVRRLDAGSQCNAQQSPGARRKLALIPREFCGKIAPPEQEQERGLPREGRVHGLYHHLPALGTVKPELLAVRDDQLGFGPVVFPAHAPGSLEKKPTGAGAGASEAGNPALLGKGGREIAQRPVTILDAAQQNRRDLGPG